MNVSINRKILEMLIGWDNTFVEKVRSNSVKDRLKNRLMLQYKHLNDCRQARYAECTLPYVIVFANLRRVFAEVSRILLV